MKKEMQALKDLIYIDPLTKTFNRKWIYNHAVDEQGDFQDKGILLFIDIADCDYLAEKYGNLIVDNVILYIAKFLMQKFGKEKIQFEIARYSNAQFVLFIKKDTIDNISSFLTNARVELSNTTLKSKSGLMFKANFNFGIVKYSQHEAFQMMLEKASSLATQEKEAI
ncbi:GGDEF domain-containing protein [Psychromonas sp. KJ10-10]|uniref:GGDEF domain-containing protein n=1 Tax=Psychromonas sp. KJ10-10 TaxID=3391823 RepID=UPI0039B6DABF